MNQQAQQRRLLTEAGVTCVQSDSVVTVTLDRPELRNAMRPSTWAALATVGSLLGDDVRVVVLRGAGKAFSAGIDTRLLAGDPDLEPFPVLGASAEEFDRLVAEYQDGFRWLRDPRFISVAAAHGYCLGAGFQLALACDIRIAADTAQFSMREPAFGLIPDLTGSKNLVDAVGYSRALEWTASARLIDAAEALRTGLVNEVVTEASLDHAVSEMVAKLTAHPHGAVTATKALFLGAAERTFDEQRTAERLAQFGRFTEMFAAGPA